MFSQAGAIDQQRIDDCGCIGAISPESESEKKEDEIESDHDGPADEARGVRGFKQVKKPSRQQIEQHNEWQQH